MNQKNDKPYGGISNIFTVSKTLRFALIPVGATLANIAKFKVIERDRALFEARKIFAELADSRFRTMLSNALSRRIIDERLSERMVLAWYRRKEDKEGWRSVYLEACDAIGAAIEAEPLYGVLFADKKEFLDSLVEERATTRAPEDGVDPLVRLGNKTTTLKTYFDQRSVQINGIKQRSVKSRIAYDNLGIFADNCAIIEEVMAKGDGALRGMIDGVIRDAVAADKFDEPADYGTFFGRVSYGLFLGQAGIHTYNAMVNGWVSEDGELHKGVNTVIREWRQQNDIKSEKESKGRNKVLSKLQKQVFSDGKGVSYVPRVFKDDDEAYAALEDLCARLRGDGSVNNIRSIIAALGQYDGAAITFNDADIRRLSHCMTSDWKVLDKALREYAGTKFLRKADIDKYMNQSRFSLSDIQAAIDGYEHEGLYTGVGTARRKRRVVDEINSRFLASAVALPAVLDKIDGICQRRVGLLEGKMENPELQRRLKELLDLRGSVALLMPNEGKTEKRGGRKLSVEEMTDMSLRENLEPWWPTIDRILLVYRATEALCRRKAYSVDKEQLVFNVSNFLGGWDVGSDGAFTNVKNKGGVILRRDGHIYLGVRNEYLNWKEENIGKAKIRKREVPELDAAALFAGTEADTYDILWLSNGKDADGLIRRLALSRKNESLFGFSAGVEAALRDKSIARLEGGALREAIVDMKKCLPKHSSFRVPARLAFLEKCDPMAYASWKEFCDAFTNVLYDVRWVKASDDVLEDAVENGRIFFFEITSTALRVLQRGDQSPEKAKDYIHDLQTVHLLDALAGRGDTKLDGNAAVYFRKASLAGHVTHREGSWLLNRRLRVNGETLPEKVYCETYGLLNHGERVSDDTVRWFIRQGVPMTPGILATVDKPGYRGEPVGADLAWMEKVGAHRAKFDITKDRCYTQDRYLFHLPVRLGMSNPYNELKALDAVNGRVDAWLASRKERNVLAINRGENNMLYAVVVNEKGKILHQQNFNIVDSIDYKVRLDDRTFTYRVASDRWQSADTVADLKTGYIANALHAITQMALRYQAVIVMESLDDRFKNDRAQLGQTIYRKFQKMLLDKLRWWVPDKAHPERVLQLTAGSRCSGMYDPGHNGIVYFVSPWATSILDPNTGFKNMLLVYDADRAPKKRKLFENMKAVRYDGRDFVFEFDYADYGLKGAGPKTSWKASTAGVRLVVEKDMKSGEWREKEVRPTDIMKDALKGVAYQRGTDVRATLASLEGNRLDEAVEALKLTMQMRNCDIGAREDWFVSPVPGGFDSRKARMDQPLTTDAVTAYNLARKCLWTIEHGGEVLSREGWLDLAQA